MGGNNDMKALIRLSDALGRERWEEFTVTESTPALVPAGGSYETDLEQARRQR